MPARMRQEDRAIVGLLGFLHGTVHANLLAIPVFLNLAWRAEFQADDVTVGLLAAAWPWRSAVGLLVLPPLLGLAWLALQRLPGAATSGPAAHSVPLRSLGTAPFARILLVYFFAGIAYQGALTFLPRFVGAGPFALALGLGAVGQVFAGTLADRRRPDRILFSLSLGGGSPLFLPPGLTRTAPLSVLAPAVW